MRKLAKVWNVITSMLVAAVVLVALVLVGVRVAGVQPLYVMSGSMEPAFHVGSLIFVQKIDPAQIKVGDPITYTINEAGDYSTHRVIAVESHETGTRFVEDENGRTMVNDAGEPVIEEYPLEETAYYFQTKGDANNSPDGTPVYYKNVVGVPRITIPYMGYLAHWLQTPRGRIMGITIAAIIVILTFLPDLLKWVEDGDKKKTAPAQTAEAAQKTDNE